MSCATVSDLLKALIVRALLELEEFCSSREVMNYEVKSRLCGV